MPFFARRTGGSRAHLELRVALFIAGATLGLVGVFLDHRGIIWGALVTLAAGALARFVPRRGEDEREDDRER